MVLPSCEEDSFFSLQEVNDKLVKASFLATTKCSAVEKDLLTNSIVDNFNVFFSKMYQKESSLTSSFQ